jgi:hypothetical protein
VAEMDAGLQHFAHGDSHVENSFGLSLHAPHPATRFFQGIFRGKEGTQPGVTVRVWDLIAIQARALYHRQSRRTISLAGPGSTGWINK